MKPFLNSFLLLFVQSLVLSALILFLFRIRIFRVIGLLLTALGVFQFIQVVHVRSIYSEIFPHAFVTPGSLVLFSAALFAIPVVYIRENAIEARKIIYTILSTNIVLRIPQLVLCWSSTTGYVKNIYNIGFCFLLK